MSWAWPSASAWLVIAVGAARPGAGVLVAVALAAVGGTRLARRTDKA